MHHLVHHLVHLELQGQDVVLLTKLLHPYSSSHGFQSRIMAWKTRVIKAAELGFELLQRKVPLLASTGVTAHNIGIHTASGIDVATPSIALVRQ